MSALLAVVFRRRATRDAKAIETWWRENRPAAPDLFVAELERALTVVSLMPLIGKQAGSDLLSGVRRVVLRRTRYYVYYRVRGEALEVLAIWHAARGREPQL
jgi:plasmid stabilization system protein ParE